MPLLDLAAHHKAVTRYYKDLSQMSLLHATHEGAVRGAFENLLRHCAQRFGWSVVAEYSYKSRKGSSLRIDAAVITNWSLVHGFWEAKDEQDDLREEVKRKIAQGYPIDNTLFQAPNRAILYQNGRPIIDTSLEDPASLVDVLKAFFAYQPPEHEDWEKAVEEFRTRVPELARALIERIEHERRRNPLFVKALESFAALCRRAINPNLTDQAVEEMLIQHILTERIFRKVFNNPDFVRRNPIAAEIENVANALTARSFNRDQFLSGLDRFYVAIEQTAATINDFSKKQEFLNTVYEKFFQGFSIKIADTHGIVYTPQPIVRFMVRSVNEILQKEFGRSLGSKEVHILDPFVGTGNFLLHVMREIPRAQLKYKYKNELHANEVMLLPYYIASMNIEHEYNEQLGEYEPYEGLCLVDTFELAESANLSFFTEKNTERVERQRRSPIFVIIGNPPYNAWQLDENDRNKNRKYPMIDKRITETYIKASKATLVNSLTDPYVRAIRWASDRVGESGIVAYVTNSSFISKLAAQGIRKHLAEDFDTIYCLDLGGNVRKNPKFSGTTHNVFGIQVGVAISFLIRHREDRPKSSRAKIFHARLPEEWRREQKYRLLDDSIHYGGIQWQQLTPDKNDTWLTEELREEYDSFIPLGLKARSARDRETRPPIFSFMSNGIKSNNDAYVYSFSLTGLKRRARAMIDEYNGELHRWQAAGASAVEDFIKVDETVLKWIRNTKRSLARGKRATYSEEQFRKVLYRPYCHQWHLFDRVFNEDLYGMPVAYPTETASRENRSIIVKVGSEMPFFVLATNTLSDLLPQGGSQVFPFYVYSEGEGGDNRCRENITDQALQEFRTRYSDSSITKWDIFYYVYAVLHHPAYRKRYKAHLERELPRIPYAPDFWEFARAGNRLADIHINYEQQSEYELRHIENRDVPFTWYVEKMRLSKQKDRIYYNEALTLAGVPLEVFEYRLGNRSALEWVIDQYQLSIDKRSGITNAPHREDDPQYIFRLIGQVITVSLETVRITRSLPPCEQGGPSAAEVLAAAQPQRQGAMDDTEVSERTSLPGRQVAPAGAKHEGGTAKRTPRRSKQAKGEN